jgi:hypothetical protein
MRKVANARVGMVGRYGAVSLVEDERDRWTMILRCLRGCESALQIAYGGFKIFWFQDTFRAYNLNLVNTLVLPDA